MRLKLQKYVTKTFIIFVHDLMAYVKQNPPNCKK
jgi:hypothetical protein